MQHSVRARLVQLGVPRLATVTVAVAVLAAVATVGALLAAQLPGQSEPPRTYHGREIAPVMSYRGAPWLERPSRDAEEDPRQVVAAMGLEGGERVVDLGCGSGYYARRLAKAVGPEGRVYGVDIQPEMLELLARYAEDAGLENVVPVLGGEADLNLPVEARGQIDWILIVDVYHELQRPQPMLQAIKAALASDGRVALVEFRLEGTTASHIKLEHRMSVDQVLQEWKPAGFELVELVETLPTQHLFIFEK